MLADKYHAEDLSDYVAELEKKHQDYKKGKKGWYIVELAKKIKKAIDVYILSNTTEIKSKVEVKYSYIDFTDYILQEKLERLRRAQNPESVYKAHTKSLMNNYKLANLTQQMVHLTQGQIRGQKVIRNIIDELFTKTSWWFSVHFIIFIFGYCVPLGLQMWTTDQSQILPCMSVCMVVQLYLIL